jgi:methylenetetrahydrofolate--tRNA-(uracil-5-)-methyltransferase
MKPVGLKNPKTGREPFAVVQLRAENKMLTSYNLVGFQTRMAYSEQSRVFKMIPGLENAEFLKLGSIHRNLYINSPSQLNKDLSSKHNPNLFFAGQITGVEGYFESTCIGVLVANFIHQKIQCKEVRFPSPISALGALLNAITDPDRAKNFQPTNINFGLMSPLSDQDHLENPAAKKDKDLKKKIQILKARQSHLSWLKQVSESPLSSEILQEERQTV